MRATGRRGGNHCAAKVIGDFTGLNFVNFYRINSPLAMLMTLPPMLTGQLVGVWLALR